jgi:hypothetical protein
MAKLSRRAFLQTSVGTATGAAAVASGGLATGGLLAAIAGSTPVEAAAASGGEPVMAYVRDASKGEVTLLVGQRQVTRRDPQLVSRLQRAAR